MPVSSGSNATGVDGIELEAELELFASADAARMWAVCSSKNALDISGDEPSMVFRCRGELTRGELTRGELTRGEEDLPT